MSGLVHPDQNVRNATENSLCRAVNRRRGCCACRASNCRRRARFSRTRSSREWKALTNQPRKCRSDTIMARIVAEKSEPVFHQVIHSAGVRRIIKRRPFGCKFVALALALEKKVAPVMDSTKDVGLDVHKEATTIAVRTSAGKLIMESIIETKAITIRQFIQGLRGELHVTFEEGTWAAWLYDLLKPYVTKVVVCDPRKNALLKVGNKSGRIDPKKLAELLRNGSLSEVYHGENGVRTLKELARSYLTISKDLGRVTNRVKALYRSWAIPCAGTQVYALCHRSEWLSKITEAGVRRRAEHYYQQLDALQTLRREVRKDLLPPAKAKDGSCWMRVTLY